MLSVMKKTVISTSLIASLIAVSGCAPNSTVKDYTDMIEGATGGLITLSTNSTNESSKPIYPINSGSTVINYKQPIILEHKTSVEIDTAAARIKRYYNFSSNEDLNELRNNQTTQGKWTAASVSMDGHKWESIPGAYYKMGKGVNNDLVTIELEKNGSVTSVFIKYEAAENSSATQASIEKLFTEIKGVAEGKIR